MDPYIAANKINKFKPDVITLDIDMPRMDGLTFLSKLMIVNPTPVIMVSALTDAGAKETLRALELGAIDFILKPDPDNGDDISEFSEALIEKILAARESKVTRRAPVRLDGVAKKLNADVILGKKDPSMIKARSERIIALGASTGGTEVINEILVNLPENIPGMVIAQHMPEKFTHAFATRVNANSRMLVKEASHGERLYRGMALVAPGGYHMLLHADNNGYWIEINDGPPVNRHKPSVDVLFRSVSQTAGSSAVGIICTGMGGDGASGLLEMKQSGAVTIAQDEASCVVFGMPREAIQKGAVQFEKNVQQMIEYIKTIQD